MRLRQFFMVVVLASASVSAQAELRREEGIGFYIGLDTRLVNVGGTYNGLDNPNGNRITLLLEHVEPRDAGFEQAIPRVLDRRRLEGLDLAKDVTTRQTYGWSETPWVWGKGTGTREGAPRYKVVAMDFGVKANILRELAGIGAEVVVVPADASAGAMRAREKEARPWNDSM